MSGHRRLRVGLAALTMAASALGGAVALGGVWAPPAGATTTTGTLVGEGGSFLEPVISKLLKDDGAGLAPDYGAYTNVTLDKGIADFVGTGAGQFNADYVVSERPLTSAESSTASTDARPYAYVPFAATGVAVVTTVPNNTYQGTVTISPAQFCQHIPLNMTDLGDIFGFNSADPLLAWSDPRLQCSDGTPLYNVSDILWANLDPTTENSAMMTLLDSDPTSKTLFDAGLQNAFSHQQATTSSDTPSETWPYVGAGVVPGGDQPLIGKLIGINALTNAPSTQAALWHLGAAAPISSVWTGAPLGVPWNLPTASIINAAGQYVYPSTAAAAAAEADATLASTTDPDTNNLVTFNPSATDDAAYNSDLMQESYLVVPTSGLPADKALALAQFVRFILGSTGQADIASFGAAPATPAMVTAGLKVAQQLDAEAAATSASTATTTTTTTSPTTTTTTAAAAGAGSTTTTTTAAASTTSGSSSSGSSGSSGSGTSGSSLAFTGANVVPLTVLGAVLVVVGELSRRALRRRRARS
ncbi:MAG: hypothetical protein ACLP9C_07775 [Acidimicrobiales bacterium]